MQEDVDRLCYNSQKSELFGSTKGQCCEHSSQKYDKCQDHSLYFCEPIKTPPFEREYSIPTFDTLHCLNC